MSLPLKEVIQYVMKNKHLKRKDLCRTDIPTSTYHRWLKHSKVTLSNLEKILLRLNLTWSEFNYLLHHNNEHITQQLYLEIIMAYQHKQISKLERLKDYCQKYAQDYPNDRFLHLENLIFIFKNTLSKKEPENYEKLPLIKYLLNNDLYTEYEFNLLNQIIVILPFPLAHKIYLHTLQNTRKLTFLSREYIRLDINFAFTAFYHFKLHLLPKIIHRLEKTNLPEMYLLDKITIQFLILLWHFLKNPTTDNKYQIIKQLKIVEKLDCPQLFKVLDHLATFIIDKLNNEK